jgi:outer membrane immunogenic protein
MKKLSLGTAAFAAVIAANAAFAADLPARPAYKAPIMAPVAFSWTGCYIGADVGYAWGRDRDTETFNGAVTRFSPGSDATPNGVKAGGYVGCNWQVQGPFVLGLEGDGEWSNLTGSTNFANTADFYETRIQGQGSVRGRIGYAVDRVLFYATGGVAFAGVTEHDVAPGAGLFEDHSTTRVGWTVGAGVDYAFTNNLIGRVEYRYADFGTFSYTSNLFGTNESHKITENVVRAGLAWKF